MLTVFHVILLCNGYLPLNRQHFDQYKQLLLYLLTEKKKRGEERRAAQSLREDSLTLSVQRRQEEVLGGVTS